MKGKRELASNILALLGTALLTGGGFLLSGAVGKEVLLVLGLNLAGNFASDALTRLRQKWISGDYGLLNHDIQRALVSALKKTLARLQREYMSRPVTDKLSKKEANSVRQAFRVLAEQAAAASPGVDGGKLDERSVIDLVTGSTEDVKAKFWARVEKTGFFSDCPVDLADFLRASLLDELGRLFREELKNPDSDGTKSWRAFQMLVLDGLKADLDSLKASEEERKHDRERLEALIAELKAKPAITPDDPLYQLLSSSLSALHESVARIEKKQETTLAGVEKLLGDERRGPERRWQYIQKHPIRGLGILFMLKAPVGLVWFREVLNDVRLAFSGEHPPFNLGRLLADSPAPNTKESGRTSEHPICAFWEIYSAEPGYWCKRIAPAARKFSVVAGFDAVAPWSVVRLPHVAKLEDLASLTRVGVSLPARVFEVGVEEFVVTFLGDTFSFSVQLSEHGLEALHEFARVQHKTLGKEGKPLPLGIGFSGVQLLEMFLSQTLPRGKDVSRRPYHGTMGMAGPNGKAISFYPSMPLGFTKSPECNEYVFKVKVPGRIDTTAKIEELQKEIAGNPANAPAYAQMAACYIYEGRTLDAIRCLENGVEKAPPNVDVHLVLAETLAKVGRFDEALLHFQKAATLTTDKDDRASAAAQTGLGVCLHELGKDAAALIHFETAVRAQPTNALHQSNCGMALMKLKRYAEAIVCYRRALELAPDDSQSATFLGILLEMEGRMAEAIPYLEAAARLTPDSADAHELLGQYLAKSNAHERAIPSLQRALDIEASARRFELLGASFGDLGRWPEAEDAFRHAVKIEPNSSGMLANLATCIANLGRFAEAAELYEQAIRVDPGNTDAKEALAMLRQVIGP